MKYAAMNDTLESSVDALNTAYETSTGVKIN
jgi:hypothetical protein